jgi:hypothetical protein
MLGGANPAIEGSAVGGGARSGFFTLFLNRRTRQPSVRFAHVFDFHRTMGDRAAAQGGTTRTRFRSFAKPPEDKTHYFGVCMGPGMLLALLFFCH